MSEEKKDQLVRDRFAAVIAAGLPEAYNQSLDKQTSDDIDAEEE